MTTINEILSVLDAAPADAEVRVLTFNAGSVWAVPPGEIVSWRGSYDVPSLTLATHLDPITAEDFAKYLRRMLSTGMIGHKGGLYAIPGDVDIRADAEGYVDNWVISAAYYLSGAPYIDPVTGEMYKDNVTLIRVRWDN